MTEHVALREYVERIFDEHEKRWNERIAALEKAMLSSLAAAEKAVTKAEAASEKRADAANEIRAAMVDQQRTLANKAEVSGQIISIERRITVLEEIANRSLGKSAGTLMTGDVGFKVIAALGALAGIIAIAITLSP